ncbi:hypothetical protein SRHO_G00032260 [Serrasalmus rhombeus]
MWWNGPCVLMTADHSESTQEDVQEEEKYSKLKTVLRVTAWIKRFITKSRSRSKVSGELTAEELNEAENYWTKVIQQESFSSEMDLLIAGKCLNTDSRIRELKPFLDEDALLSVGGRLQHSDLCYREKHPWILPSKHKYTEMVVQNQHEQICHAGVQDTLVQTREKYWILKAWQVVRKVVSGCVFCRKFKAKPGQQTTAPLPRDRITESPPFEVAGVDFAGPLYVKIQSSMAKAYIALFTCTVTRAVHLELVSAAWWGGFWERLVRSVKIILRKVLGRAKLNFEEMCTMLTEAKAIINSRPLTYVSNDVDQPEPLPTSWWVKD